VGIEQAIFNGRLRIIFRPLLSEMPVIGAVQVCTIVICVYQSNVPHVAGNGVTIPLPPFTDSLPPSFPVWVL
jgi:hypothetical protein